MPARQRPQVLVVEDEWIIADQIEAALKAAGYDVVGPVGRITQASALLKDERVDAALIDINIHGERSFALAADLADASIPFAFLSGYSDVQMPPLLRRRPLMQKPVDASAVRRCVASLLSGEPSTPP